MTDTAPATSPVIYEDGLPVPRRHYAVIAMSMAITLAVLGSTIATVALPTIAAEFGAREADSIWVVNAYQIAVVGSLLPLASLGEIVGFRRISQGGLILFTLASIACALATSIEALIAARVLQGLGASALMAVNGALVRFTFPLSQLGRAVAITALTTSLASAIGPSVAGAILSVASWRWLFGINIPIGLIALTIALFNLPHSALDKRSLNWIGAAMYAATLGLFVMGLQSFSHEGTYLIGASSVTVAILLGVLLVRREVRRARPLIPLDLLRIPIFSLSLATSICSFAAQMLAMVALPFDLQNRLGYSAAEIGLLLTPWPLAVAVAAPIVARLLDRWPAATLGGIGLNVMALGLVLLALTPPHASPADLIWRMVLCGLGFGLFQTPNNRILLGVAPRERAGAAGGMLGTARLVGQSLGAVGVALCFHLSPSIPTAWALGAGAAAAALAGAISVLRPSA